MRREHVSRRGPFALAGAALLAVTIVIFLMPESLVELMQRAGALEGGQADWAYRLLALAAVVQAAYGGFAVLRPERLGTDPQPSTENRAQAVATVVARNAAGMTCLTIVYGIAAFALTGLRGGFWLFVAVAILQGAWYYRAVGIIEKWVERQPASKTAPLRAAGHDHEAYCPPLARDLIDSPRDMR